MATIPPFNFFGYDPNLPLAIVTLTAFAILTIVHLGLNIRNKTWYFMVLPAGTAMEVFGFSFRIYARSKVGNVAAYTLFTLPVLLTPTVLAMADYTLTSKLLIKSGITNSLFRPPTVRYVFLLADIFAFIVQGGGAGVLSSGGKGNMNLSNIGSKMILTGLVISLLVFVFFAVFTLNTHIKSLRQIKEGLTRDDGWMNLFWVLYFDMILLITRSIYRAVEFSYPTFLNPVSTNEKLFYSLDILFMFLIVVLWVFFHPSKYDFENNNIAVRPSEDKGKEPV